MLCPTLCGNSLQFVSAGATCRCGYSRARTGGVVDFIDRSEPAVEDAPAAGSAIEPRHFQQLSQVLNRTCKRGIPVAVEFGAGNGGWTFGMDQSERFHEVYAIDVSVRSLSMLRKVVSRPRTHLVCQVAEQLDFPTGSVDLVVGRSFLRRVADYETLLAKCARWLKPDGAAIFYEPCIQGKIWIAVLTKLLLELETQPAVTGWDMMRRNLGVLYRKGHEQPRARDDRWIFDRDALRDTAQNAGFATLDVIDADERLLAGFKRTICDAMADRAKRARTRAMLEAFEDRFSNSDPKMLVSPMVFFVFRKVAVGRNRPAARLS